MGVHRYWRIRNPSGSNNAYFFTAFTLEMRETQLGPDVAVGRTATAYASGSYNGTLIPSKAFDGDPNTGWASPLANPGAGAWIAQDFGAGNEKDINQISLLIEPGSGASGPKDILVEYSDDNVGWTTYWTAPMYSPFWIAGEKRVLTNPAFNSRPDAANLMILGVEESGPTDPIVSGMMMIAVIDGPSKTIALGPPIQLPCWQPCTAFGTEALVIRLN